MPLSKHSPRLHSGARAEYSYRRKLGVSETLPAIGVAVAAGLFAFYVTRLLLQRTPLIVETKPRLTDGRSEASDNRAARRAAARRARAELETRRA